MGDIINLRRARKRQASAQAEAKAVANRILFGASKSAKSKATAERAAADRRLEAHRRPERGNVD
jgi:hypothetical protein